MIPLSTTFVHGLLLCLPFTAFVAITFGCWPRLWLHSLPPDIAEMAGPKSAKEERQTRFLVLAFLVVLPGLSIVSTIMASVAANTNLTWLGAVRHLYIVWVIVHAWDLVVIDFGYALVVNPKRPPIAQTEGAKGYRDYWFHVRSFLRAVPMSALFVVPAAFVVSLVV